MQQLTIDEQQDVYPADVWRRSVDAPGGRRFQPAILFVCTANRIRSPLAEYILRDACMAQLGHPAWRVESAGLWADDGLTAASSARRAGLERGLDLSNHRSRSICSAPLDEYDLILPMERSHTDLLIKEYPRLAKRTLTLAEVVTGRAYDIMDPPGHTLRSVRATVHELSKLIENGLVSILSRIEADKS